MTGKVAIIGTGPSGCYLAQALAKSCPAAEITLIDALPVPYGLVRYGVAADHQGTKAVTRQFARLFERQGVGFVGNLTIGDGPGQMPLDDLRAAMDAVVIATGLEADHVLDVPGANRPGVIGAGALTRYWNGHPDASPPDPALGPRVAILGNGNVAVDILRILAKGPEDFEGSDFDPALVCDAVREIHVIGRSPLADARFDTVMIKELAQLRDVAFSIADLGGVGNAHAPKTAAVLALCNRSVVQPRKHVVFHSGWTPREITGDRRISGLSLEAAQDGRTRMIDCETLITAIGFTHGPGFDRVGLLTAATGAEQGILAPGLFATGWFKRGPRGTIPDNRSDAQAVAQLVSQRLALATGKRPGRAALIARFGAQLTEYDDWRAVDDAERAAAPPGRCRAKLTSRPALQAIIEKRKQTR